jgi:hypothetical protein
MMKHSAMEDWVDFVRDVLAPEQKIAMQHHLDTGCARCSKNLQLWQQVHTLAAREIAYHPPENAVRSVKGSFALDKPPATRSRRTRLAQLVLDSFRQPALAGARATGQSPRQLLYKTGALLIDLRMERLSGSRLSLVGQVLDSNHAMKGVEGLPVKLSNPLGSVSLTATNEFGEFHLEIDGGSGLRLSVGANKAIEIHIPAGEFYFRPTGPMSFWE